MGIALGWCALAVCTLLLLGQCTGTCLVMGSASRSAGTSWCGGCHRTWMCALLLLGVLLRRQFLSTCLVMGSASVRLHRLVQWLALHLDGVLCSCLGAAAEAAHEYLPGDGQCFLVRWHELVRRWASHLDGVPCSCSVCCGGGGA